MFVYEIGNIFIPKELPIKDLPIEKKNVVYRHVWMWRFL